MRATSIPSGANGPEQGQQQPQAALSVRISERQFGGEVYWHYTTATDTNHISTVFNSVSSMIIVWNLTVAGIL
jgi:hypothetical protein